MAKKNILFAAFEASPFIKTGGLGDVAGALPSHLKSDEFDCRVILPLLSSIPEEYRNNIIKELESKDWNTFDKNKVELFLAEHGLKQCQQEWGSQSGQIEMMLNGNDMVGAEEELMEILNG